jgi:hypothetical protein
MLNQSSAFVPPHIYTAEEVSIILAAIAAMVVSIIYSFKHIKSSDCCCVHCKQDVGDGEPAAERNITIV